MSVDFFAMEKTLQIGQNNTIISTNPEKNVIDNSLSHDASKDLNTIDTGEIYTQEDKIFHKKSGSTSVFAQSKIIE